MIRLILKNLFARRRRNIWLLAELILVCIIVWVIGDPLVVLTHDRNLPEGFRSENLFVVVLAELPEESVRYRAEDADTLQGRENLERMMERLRSYEGVEHATWIPDGLMPYGSASSNTNMKIDTTKCMAEIMTFVSQSDFFQTFGMEGAEGMTAADLDKHPFTARNFVLTEDLVSKLPDGKPLYNRVITVDSVDYRVAGVVEPFRMRSYVQPLAVRLEAKERLSFGEDFELPQLAFRTNGAVSEDVFLHHFRPWMAKELKTGNYYACSVRSYSDIRKEHEFSSGITNEYRINIALGVFFLVNLCLGVAGSFWMQTRSRKEEVGIMLSFGATPGHIIRMLLGEGWVLTTLGTLAGCLIYLQFVLKDGLYTTSFNAGEVSPEYWVNHFGMHFIVVSVIVYLILLAIVWLGIWIPAYKISRIQPMDALRDE